MQRTQLAAYRSKKKLQGGGMAAALARYFPLGIFLLFSPMAPTTKRDKGVK